jgi:hypothetical protein
LVEPVAIHVALLSFERSFFEKSCLLLFVDLTYRGRPDLTSLMNPWMMRSLLRPSLMHPLVPPLLMILFE